MTISSAVALVLAAILAAPLAAGAEQPKAIVRIGLLSSSSPERERPLFAAFQQTLRELGHAVGKDLVFEQRYSGGKFEKLPEMAVELVRLNVDVLVVTGAPAARAAKNATASIPTVMTNVADPVGIGLVTSLSRPGGNITGLSDFNTGVVAKRLELLKEVVPSASRVAVLLNPSNPTNLPQMKLLDAAARTLGVTLFPFEATRAEEIDRAFAAIRAERLGALIVVGDPFFGVHRKKIVALAAKMRLPAIYSTRQTPDEGGLMSYGTNFEDLYRRAAIYVDKILKGARPADLPVEQPTKLELVINLNAARALGLTIPPPVLLRADDVVQ